jgi:hypothetical protein
MQGRLPTPHPLGGGVKSSERRRGRDGSGEFDPPPYRAALARRTVCCNAIDDEHDAVAPFGVGFGLERAGPVVFPRE